METTLEMIKKVALATKGRAPSVSKAFVMKTNVLFGIYDNDGQHQERKAAKIGRGVVLMEAHGEMGEAMYYTKPKKGQHLSQHASVVSSCLTLLVNITPRIVQSLPLVHFKIEQIVGESRICLHRLGWPLRRTQPHES